MALVLSKIIKKLDNTKRPLTGTTLSQKKHCQLGSVVVGASGLEPPTPTLSGWCSNLLSYAPK